MRQAELYKSHKNLYRAICVFGIWAIVLGSTLLLTVPHAGTFTKVVAGVYIALGIFKLVGANTQIKWARMAMASCVSWNVFLASLTILSFLFGRGSRPYLYTAVNLLFIALIELIILVEPPVQTAGRDE